MVNIKLTFIPGDGNPAKDYAMDNFDVTGITGAKLKELVSEKVNVPVSTYFVWFTLCMWC